MTPGQPKVGEQIYSVPNLKFDDLPIHLHFLCGELNSHGGIAVVIKLVVIVGGKQ